MASSPYSFSAPSVASFAGGGATGFPCEAQNENRQYDSGTTSNDLLEKLTAEHAPVALNDQIVAQSVEDAQNIENAPAIGMEPYLEKSQTF